jgi:catechol 2,3-dioxygenase-like lactoylglutathione lyase family enzyme
VTAPGLSLAALSLLIPDYDSAIAFFVKGLGFRLTADIDQGHKRWVTVAAPGGGSEIVLARAETAQQQAALGAQAGGRVWLFLKTPDFAADYARLIAAGAVFEEAPRDEPYGRVAVWRDPWGNRWDLIQPVA